MERLTIKQAAQYIGKREEVIRLWVANKEIQVKKVDDMILISRDAIDRLLINGG